ncbi:hypothetical protein G6F70_008103 [Rhizopus microsporus]|uniref:SH3 domain-containing protein n=1 Tax=Rhizopus azygosporus TaxID=86630 RepID=A0A367JNE4_RHIAZ|nr:hypothetical protein G6F71_006110 [Rhizopus microsporus]KAG1195606.1 hypothetical protein G6F70_008103 [Rhizopus microsporus]KAG1207442.1 hypothetical protein G6F69_008045 [Rhizopus microsporus]RCH91446.1 hypothetical protein CU097_012064 [Rhizopus azygosporus]
MSIKTRHSSIDALRERYQKARQWAVDNGTLSTSPTVTTVYEEEEHEKSEEEEREEEKEEEEEEDDNNSIYSSSSSIPDEDINFDLVYALHTFVATVDGQASVIKGDAMTLLDDTNSYWWLVRALKTSEVGYIPAENIETPFERLARLNKHRNVEVTSIARLPDHVSNNSNKQPKKKRVKLSKELACQLQIILTDEDNDSSYEQVFEHWEEVMSINSALSTDNTDVDDISQSSISSSNSDNDDDDDDNKQTIKTASTLILNPELNRSIHLIQEEEDSRATRENNKNNKPLPLLQFDDSKKDVQGQQHQQQKSVTGLKRLFSIGNSNSKKDKIEEFVENRQYHVLRIFAGNINVGAMFATVAVTPDMNADQLLKLALQKFHIPLLTDKSNTIEYYLTVKSMDNDELTLLPQDKPLAIFESLSDHLTTPMPSLTSIKKLSIEQPTIKVTRVGVSKARQRAKAHFGEDSVIRFSLHKRIKRTIDGQVYVKISYYVDNDNIKRGSVLRKSSLLRKDVHPKKFLKKERIDKLVATSSLTRISDLIITALEKFHLKGQDYNMYYMTILINGRSEKTLPMDRSLVDILNDSELIPKGTTEKSFILHKKEPMQSAGVTDLSYDNNRRSMVRKLLKQQDSNHKYNLSSTETVIKKLDEAIQSLEHDKRQISAKVTPARSNSLSTYYDKKHSNDFKRSLPTRSSSLKLSGDAFDSLHDSDLSNMDDLELELQRIATSS